MPTKVQELIARLEADGWYLVRQKGSHRQYHDPDKPGYRDRDWQAKCRHPAWHSEQHAQAGRIEEVRSRMQYLVVIERGPSSYGAYVPDLPGCVAVGETREEVTTLIHEAIEFHIEGLKADGLPVPVPHSSGELISVDA